MPRKKKSGPPLVIVPTTADHGPSGSARARNGVIVPNFTRGFAKDGQPTRAFHGFKVLSPLLIYRRRKTITDREALAGKVYANEWHVAQACLPRVTARYDDMPGPPSGKPPTGFNGSAWPMEKIERLHAQLGDVASRLMMAVCLDGIGVLAYAKEAKWRRPEDAWAILRCGLQTTAEFFKLPEE